MSELRQLKLPPRSVQAEQSLLGALLIDATAWARVQFNIAEDDFYRHDHQVIFSAIADLHRRDIPVDMVTITDHLDRTGTVDAAGGLAYVGRLARDTPGGANVETYAATVRERAALRRLQVIGRELSARACDGGEASASEIAAQAQQILQEARTHSRHGKGLVDARSLVTALCDDLDERSRGSRGLKLGLPDLDDLTFGLEPGDLVVVAARPGMGKTALMTSIASSASDITGTAIFSAEMPAQQLMRRVLSLQAAVPQGTLRRPDTLADADWANIATAASAISRKRLWIDDTGQPALAHIRAETLALKARQPLGLVLVDYVQLVIAPGSNRYEQLRDVAYGLKSLAKELAAPIIILAQLNRDVERRDRKRPALSDLRDSGAIEEAADIVGLLYSEGYYTPDFEMPYVLECEIAKNRNGERGHCLWRFDGAYSRVAPLDSGARAQYRRLLSKQSHRGNADL